jgi:hypothetical protein
VQFDVGETAVVVEDAVEVVVADAAVAVSLRVFLCIGGC